MHLLKLWPLVLVDLPVFPDMPGPVDYNHGLNWNPIDASFPSQSMASNSKELGFEFSSAESGFNFDFENMDINALSWGNLDHDVRTTFNYEQAFMEAALLIGVQENRSNSDIFQADGSQLALPLAPYPSHPNIDTMLSIGTLGGLTSPSPVQDDKIISQ